MKEEVFMKNESQIFPNYIFNQSDCFLTQKLTVNTGRLANVVQIQNERHIFTKNSFFDINKKKSEDIWLE